MLSIGLDVNAQVAINILVKFLCGKAYCEHFRFACSFLLSKSLNETRRLLDFHSGADMLSILTVTHLPGS